MNQEKIRFCVQCGSTLQKRDHAGEIRPVCPECGWVYFPDPKVAVAIIIEKENKLLFVQRGIDPFRGFWTLPAGFLDAGENPIDAAVREVQEETALRVEITDLLGILNVQEYEKGAHLLIIYRGEILAGKLQAGDDAVRAEFFHPDQPPPFAFKSTRQILKIAGYI